MSTIQQSAHLVPTVKPQSKLRDVAIAVLVFVGATWFYLYCFHFYKSFQDSGFSLQLLVGLGVPSGLFVSCGCYILYLRTCRQATFCHAASEIPFIAIENLDEHGPFPEALQFDRDILKDYVHLLAESQADSDARRDFKLLPSGESLTINILRQIASEFEKTPPNGQDINEWSHEQISRVGHSLWKLHEQCTGQCRRRFAGPAKFVPQFRQITNHFGGRLDDVLSQFSAAYSSIDEWGVVEYQEACLMSRLVFVYSTVGYDAVLNSSERTDAILRFLESLKDVVFRLSSFTAPSPDDQERLGHYSTSMERRHSVLHPLFETSSGREASDRYADAYSYVHNEVRELLSRSVGRAA